MALAPIVATQLTTPQTRSMSLFVGGRDLTREVKWDSLVITDSGSSAKGIANLHLMLGLASLPEVTDQAALLLVDHLAEDVAYRGYVRSRHPVSTPRYDGVDLVADDIGSILDDTWIASAVRPAETLQARVGYLWGAYAGSHLSGDLSYVAAIGAGGGGGTLPAQNFAGVTLRQALEAAIGQASSAAEYYVDMLGRLHVFTAETNDAPFNIDAAGVAGIAPHELDIDYDSNAYANRVYIQGATPAGSGFFADGAAIAAANGLVRTAVLRAPDCETAAMARSLANMYLGRVSEAKMRGSFSVTSRGVPYQRAVLRLVPVAYWRLGESSGTSAADASGNGHTGTYVNAPTLGVAGALTGDANKAVTLNGSTQRVDAPVNDALHPGDTLSLAAWVKRSSSGTADTIIDGGTGDYLLWFFSDDKLYFSKSAVSNLFASTATFTDTNWHFVVATKAGATIAVYVDGVAIAGTVANATLVPTTNAPRMGATVAGTDFFGGALDEVAIFNRALTAGEIAALYEAGTTGSRDGWRGGQNVAVTSAAHGVAAVPARIARVTTRIVKGGADPMRRYSVEFGGSRAGGSRGGPVSSQGGGQVVSGQLGGASNVYVTSDGVAVTDGIQVRAQLGRLPSGDYGLRVVASDGATVIIDGVSNVFKILVSGTITTASFTQPNEATATVDVTTGLNVDPANLCFIDLGDGAHAVPMLVPSTLATDPNPTHILDLYEAWVADSTTADKSTVTARTRSWRSGGTEPVRTYRYNVFAETAF